MSRQIRHYVDTDPSALFGDGNIPDRWEDRRREEIARLVDMTEAAILDACPGAVVEVVPLSGGGRHTADDARDGYYAYEAAQRAWVRWSERL